MSTILGLQLGITVAIPALLKGTEPLGMIITICVIAVASALYIELISAPLRVTLIEPRQVPLVAARSLLIIGVAAIAVTTLGGQGSYAVQLGLVQQSPLVSVFTPFDTWAMFGAVLYMWFYREGMTTKRHTWIAVGSVMATHASAGLYRAILGQAAAAIVTLLIIALLMGLVRFRVLAGVITVFVIIWPTVYELRDSMRLDASGSGSLVSSGDAMGRLQLDEQMSVVGRFEPNAASVQAPTIATVIRTGLLPSIVDSSRPPLDTGSRMSLALGGTSLNSRSGTFFGNVYIFEGLETVAAAGALIAVAMGLTMRRSSTPWAFMVAGLVYQSSMSFNATYPNGIAGFLQGMEAMLVAYLFVHFLRVRGRRDDSII